jgi:hypothetical protein
MALEGIRAPKWARTGAAVSINRAIATTETNVGLFFI